MNVLKKIFINLLIMFGFKRYITVLIIWLFLKYDKNRLWLNNIWDYDDVVIDKPKIVIAFELADSFIKNYNAYKKFYEDGINK